MGFNSTPLEQGRATLIHVSLLDLLIYNVIPSTPESRKMAEGSFKALIKKGFPHPFAALAVYLLQK